MERRADQVVFFPVPFCETMVFFGLEGLGFGFLLFLFG